VESTNLLAGLSIVSFSSSWSSYSSSSSSFVVDWGFDEIAAKMAEMTGGFRVFADHAKPGDEDEDDHEDEWDLQTTSTSTSTSTSRSRSRNEYVPEYNPGGRELEATLQPLIEDLFASNLNRKLNRKCYHPEQSSPGLLSPAF
jgi:hypothetical protein